MFTNSATDLDPGNEIPLREGESSCVPDLRSLNMENIEQTYNEDIPDKFARGPRILKV